jgi:hypothetical protein
VLSAGRMRRQSQNGLVDSATVVIGGSNEKEFVSATRAPSFSAPCSRFLKSPRCLSSQAPYPTRSFTPSFREWTATKRVTDRLLHGIHPHDDTRLFEGIALDASGRFTRAWLQLDSWDPDPCTVLGRSLPRYIVGKSVREGLLYTLSAL